VDFSAEMERTLQVLDYAVLVVSGADGVQSHTETLWRLLEGQNIPTFLFINKMDQPGTDRAALLSQLRERLSDGCADFTGDRGELMEHAALCDEELMERYLETGTVLDEELSALIVRRQLFPCFFGSALKLDGVDALLDGLAQYTLEPDWSGEFGAKIFQIRRDDRGDRLTWLKVTGGTLKVRALLSGGQGDDRWEEKVSQIRLYSGAKFVTAEEAPAGTVCAVTGLTHTRPGQGLGAEEASAPPELEPVLTYAVLPPEGCDIHKLLQALRLLEEEDPQLQVLWNENLGEIHVRLMGDIQRSVLTRLVSERFGIDVTFGTGSIVYKETVAAPVEGVGHFEPLRHYAEVHLLLEPLEQGAGLQFDTICPEDVLDRNWQRLILTHLAEKTHRGVLTGSPITDMKIILLTGRAHIKHTEGGDFRQATYRAVRQGLRMAESILLEPWYDFRLEVPSDCLGRAMTDIQQMSGRADPAEHRGETAVLTGSVPVSELGDYWTEVASYTKGRGRLTCALRGYEPCHNTDEVVARLGYDPDRDVDAPCDSVFCAHGGGFTVKWDEVRGHMHVDSGWRPAEEHQEEPDAPAVPRPAVSYADSAKMEKELEAIFTRTYGPIKPRAFAPTPKTAPKKEKPWKGLKPRAVGEEYLLVDGYNIIHAWDDLSRLAREDLDGARRRLMDILSNYQGWRKCRIILVFDAYKVKGNPGSVEKYHNIHVVYTKEAETADMYIEKTTYDIAKEHRVRVATSDGLEQLIILGHGAARLSARELRFEIDQAERQIRDIIENG
jgi:translation elongation factor EF-G/predicted RNA-binding protein with PIN domain